MRTYKVQCSTLLFFFVMLPFIEPRCFTEVPFFVQYGVHTFYSYARFAALAVIVLYNCIRIKARHSTLTKLVILYYVFLLISTIVGGQALRAASTYASEACGICIFADLFIGKYGVRQYCNNMFRLLILFVLINCATILMFPGGMYMGELDGMMRNQNWFFGYKNSHIYIYLPCLFFAFLYGAESKRRISYKYWLLAALVLISIFISESLTSTVLLVVFIAYLWFVLHRKKALIGNPYIQYAFILLVNAALLFWNVVERFQDLISMLFNRYSTVISRTVIWQSAIYYTLQSPILGNGIEDYEVSLAKIYGQAHNKLLDIAYTGGIIGLVLFLVILLCVMHVLFKANKNNAVMVCGAVFLCYNILFLTEAQRSNPLYFVILVAIYHICKQNTKSMKNTLETALQT